MRVRGHVLTTIGLTVSMVSSPSLAAQRPGAEYGVLPNFDIRLTAPGPQSLAEPDVLAAADRLRDGLDPKIELIAVLELDDLGARDLGETRGLSGKSVRLHVSLLSSRERPASHEVCCVHAARAVQPGSARR